jgi:hypothetical protein
MSKEFEYRPQPNKQSEQHKPQQEGGNGSPGIPPTLQERAKPPPESQERKPQTRIVYNPNKETWEEYKKRFDEALPQRREKLRQYNREYKRRWRKARKEQRKAALPQREQEQLSEAIEIFPSPPKT